MKLVIKLIIVILATIILVSVFLEESEELRNITIDPGHGGDVNKLYSYFGDEYIGVDNLNLVDKNLTGGKNYYIIKGLDQSDKKNWLHTGDSGAHFTFNGINYSEKDINLNISLILGEYLSKEFRVQFTREGDRFLFLEARREVAIRNKSDLFISIHQNSFAGNCENLNHAEVYYNNPSLNNLAEEILKEMSDEFNLNKGFVKRTKDLAVLNMDQDAILVEVNFMCNERNAELLSNASYQRKVAQIIWEAVER